MRILVTGGWGFVGARLAQHLYQAGHSLILGSRCQHNPPSWLPNTEVVQTNWHDEKSLGKICKGIDVVIHAAGSNANDCSSDPIAALEFNGAATMRLLAAANSAGVGRLIYISTAHVYADPLTGIISEKTRPTNMHPYATSHLAGENAVLSASHEGQIKGIVLRLSNAFGVPLRRDTNCWMLLVNDLCRQAIESRSMILRSNGLQQRNFIELNYVCRVMESLIRNDSGGSEPLILNVGSGSSHSVIEIAELIQQRCQLLFGYEPELQRLNGGPSVDEESNNFEYRRARLASLISIPPENNSGEIDRLLLYCRAEFDPLVAGFDES